MAMLRELCGQAALAVSRLRSLLHSMSHHVPGRSLYQGEFAVGIGLIRHARSRIRLGSTRNLAD